MDPLKGKYTHFQRLVHRFQARRDIPFRRQFFMGYDLYGNTYWEFTIDGNMQRLRRKLEPYGEQLFKADYFRTVPPQWFQWLRRTRIDPPTLEELINDQVRQQKIKVLAQQADQKWIMEKERLEEEHRLKLESELARAKEPVAREEPSDPWKAADSDKTNQPSSATITSRR
ncbi:hypothetical protein CAAN3_05S03422 [[Candida] anglica]